MKDFKYIIDSKKNASFFSNILLYKELFYFFTWRDIKVKYKQTALGFLWIVLQPLLMMLLLSLVLGRAISSFTELQVPYPLYVISGLIFWNLFSSALASAGNSMVSNANIIKKIYFPRVIIPLSSVLTSAFDFLISLCILILVLLYYQHSIVFVLFLGGLIAAFLSTLIATTGLSLLLSALNVKYRDFRYVIPFLIQLMMFISPVMYPSSMFPEKFQYVFALNPMYAPIEMARFAIGIDIENFNMLFLSLTSACLLLILGTVYFNKTENYFADIA